MRGSVRARRVSHRHGATGANAAFPHATYRGQRRARTHREYCFPWRFSCLPGDAGKRKDRAGAAFAGGIHECWRGRAGAFAMKAHSQRAGSFVIGLPAAWLFLFVLLPLLIVLAISLVEMRTGSPPYTPFFTWESGLPRMHAQGGNYALLFSDRLYIDAFLSSIRI